MNRYTKAAFGCFFTIGLMAAYMGIKYLMVGEIRLHHLEIIGVESWDDVVPGYKVFLLMFMKGAGLGYLTTAVALAVLLFGPFRKHQAWAAWGVTIILFVQLGGRFINILIASSGTPNSAPVGVLAVAILLGLTGAFCSVKLTPNQPALIQKKRVVTYPLLSTVCSIIVLVMATITAGIYMFSTEIMPYHLSALGVSSWHDINPGYQTMLLTYMRGAGLGFLTLAVAIAVLLAGMAKNPENWLRWGILTVSLTHILVMMWIVIFIRANTPGQPPIIPLTAAAALSVAAFFIPAKKREGNV